MLSIIGDQRYLKEYGIPTKPKSPMRVISTSKSFNMVVKVEPVRASGKPLIKPKRRTSRNLDLK